MKISQYEGLGTLRLPEEHRQPVKTAGFDVKQLIGWHRSMVLIRRVEEVIADLVESGEVRCPCHLAIGQEAVAVGVASGLFADDKCFGAHRSHSHYLALGAPVEGLLAEVLGRSTGCSGGFGGSMHLKAPEFGLVGTVPIVGATIPIAVGAALALKLDGENFVAVSFLGDGATEEGVFHESLNLAASMKLPVLFVIENNLYASHLHIDYRQPGDSLVRYADAHHIARELVDGNNIVDVAQATNRLLTIARTERRPAVLEAVTYRWRGHVGHREDIDVGVERQHNLPSWKQRDPISRLEQGLLIANSKLEDEFVKNRNEVDLEIAEALSRARSAPYPDASELLRIVYHQRNS